MHTHKHTRKTRLLFTFYVSLNRCFPYGLYCGGHENISIVFCSCFCMIWQICWSRWNICNLVTCSWWLSLDNLFIFLQSPNEVLLKEIPVVVLQFPKFKNLLWLEKQVWCIRVSQEMHNAPHKANNTIFESLLCDNASHHKNTVTFLSTIFM